MRVSIYRIAGVLVLTMMLVLAACGGGTAEENGTSDTEAEPTTAVESNDEPTDEPADEPTDEPADEPADEPTDEPADESETVEFSGEQERNDQGGYSFIVPEEWKLLSNESLPEFGTITTLAPQDSDEDDPEALIMMVAGDTAAIYSGAETDIDITEASIDELMQISSDNNEDMNLADFEEIEVDGMDARMASVQGEDASMGDIGGSMVIVLLEDDRVMQMIALAEADQWDQEFFTAFVDHVEFFEPVAEESEDTGATGDGSEGDAMTGPDNPALDLPSTDQGAVEIGGEASATLDTIFEVHDWTFEGEAGQVVTISVAAAAGSEADPRINLLGPDGEWLIADDDGGNGTDARIEGYSLPASGSYTIKVDVFTGGEYVLSVSESSGSGEGAAPGADATAPELATDVDVPDASAGGGNDLEGSDNAGLELPSTEQGVVEAGGEASATLDTIFEAHDWTFEGEAGQVVTISVAAAAGSEVDPRINLLGPDGEWLAANDDGGSGTDALIEGYTLPANGTYTIKVDVFEGGEYVLTVE